MEVSPSRRTPMKPLLAAVLARDFHVVVGVVLFICGGLLHAEWARYHREDRARRRRQGGG